MKYWHKVMIYLGLTFISHKNYTINIRTYYKDTLTQNGKVKILHTCDTGVFSLFGKENPTSGVRY